MIAQRAALAAGELTPVITARIGTFRTPLEPGSLASPGLFVYPGNEWYWGPDLAVLDFTLGLDIQTVPAGQLTLTIAGDLDGVDYSLSAGPWHPVDLILSYQDSTGTPVGDARHIALVITKQALQFDEAGPVTTLTASTIEILSQDNLALNRTSSGNRVVAWRYSGFLTHAWMNAADFMLSEMWSRVDDVVPALSLPGTEDREYPMPDEAFNVMDMALMAAQDLGYTTFPNLDPGRVLAWNGGAGLEYQQHTIAALDLVKFEDSDTVAWDLGGLILPGAQIDFTPEEWATELFVTQTWEDAAGRQEKRTRYPATGVPAGAVSKSASYTEESRPWPRDPERFQAMADRWYRRRATMAAALLPAYWITPGDPVSSAAGVGYVRSLSFTPTGTTLNINLTRRFRGWIGGTQWAAQDRPWTAATDTWKEA